MKTKKILVAPLDWGLGHATRCIPIIELLLQYNCEVHIASSGSALKLLIEEFPNLKHFELPSYKASYGRYLSLMIKVLLQVPKFFLVIKKEKNQIEKIAEQNTYDLVISDNRYGCRLPNVKSIFIGHQINLIMPEGLKWITPMINYFNHHWIMRFDECWIPDDPQNSLTGKLSHPSLPLTKWIGVISRFNKEEEVNKEYQLAVILSGPEPQRTIFEKMVLKQMNHINQKTIFVRGVLDETNSIDVPQNVKVVNYMHKENLQHVIVQSELILARPGYTTIMDLQVMEKRAIFVPTPGQTEQEYLGNDLMQKGVAYCESQAKFDLGVALKKVNEYSGFKKMSNQHVLLKQVIEAELK